MAQGYSGAEAGRRKEVEREKGRGGEKVKG